MGLDFHVWLPYLHFFSLNKCTILLCCWDWHPSFKERGVEIWGMREQLKTSLNLFDAEGIQTASENCIYVNLVSQFEVQVYKKANSGGMWIW